MLKFGRRCNAMFIGVMMYLIICACIYMNWNNIVEVFIWSSGVSGLVISFLIYLRAKNRYDEEIINFLLKDEVKYEVDLQSNKESLESIEESEWILKKK